MEYMIAAVLVVFLCLFCAWFGYKIGVKNREVKTVVIKDGQVITQESVETSQINSVEPTEEEKAYVEQFENLKNFEAKYPGVKNG
jgi:hypothetical protein